MVYSMDNLFNGDIRHVDMIYLLSKHVKYVMATRDFLMQL